MDICDVIWVLYMAIYWYILVYIGIVEPAILALEIQIYMALVDEVSTCTVETGVLVFERGLSLDVGARVVWLAGSGRVCSYSVVMGGL